jgi:hypothetical protein
MRTKIVIFSLVALVILAALIPQVDAAAIRILVPVNDEPTLDPIVTGNLPFIVLYESPSDICVAEDGTIFTVSVHPVWQFIRGAAPVSFVAWNSDGSIRWSQRFTSWTRVLLGVTADDTHVFVTGVQDGNLFLGKYDFQGNKIWNVTWNYGEYEIGMRITLTDDGSIMVGGSTRESRQSDDDVYCLLCFDTNGALQWQKMNLTIPEISGHSNYVYAIHNGNLEKYKNDGDVLWSTEYSDGLRVSAHSEILHTISQQVQNSIITINGWNVSNGNKIWSSNITFEDANSQVFNITHFSQAISSNGTLTLLCSLQNRNSSQIISIDQNGDVISNQIIIDETWRYSEISIEDDKLYLAAYRNSIGIGMAIYNLSSIYENTNEGFLNRHLIGITIVGVVLFDVCLVIFLKKRYAN